MACIPFSLVLKFVCNSATMTPRIAQNLNITLKKKKNGKPKLQAYQFRGISQKCNWQHFFSTVRHGIGSHVKLVRCLERGEQSNNHS